MIEEVETVIILIHNSIVIFIQFSRVDNLIEGVRNFTILIKNNIQVNDYNIFKSYLIYTSLNS